MKQFSAEGMVIIVGIVIAYILFTTWLTWRLRSKNSGDFMAGSNVMPAFVVGVMLMSEYIGAKSTIGTAQAAFEDGFAASWSVIGAAIGFPLFGFLLVKRIYNTGKITISGAIAERYGNSTKNIISIIMIYALLLVNVGNYVSGAAAISTVLNLDLTTAAVITALVSTFYFMFGGMKGIAWVTLLHSGLKYIGILVILGVALHMTGGVSPMIKEMPHFYWTWDGNVGASLDDWHHRVDLLHPVCDSGYRLDQKCGVCEARHLGRILLLYADCHRHCADWRGGKVSASGD